MKGRNAVAHRLSKLLFYLPRFDLLDGETLDMLAAWCGCTRRTLYRDLDALRSAGFKVPSTERQAA
jgi:predicted DNA-binding transcriptional regulator YafY